MRRLARLLLSLLLLVLALPASAAAEDGSASTVWTSPMSAVITWSAPVGVTTVCVWHDSAIAACVPASDGQLILSDAPTTDAAAHPMPYHRYWLEWLPTSQRNWGVWVTLDHRPPVPRVWLPLGR